MGKKERMRGGGSAASRNEIKGHLAEFYTRVAHEYHQFHYQKRPEYSPLRQRQVHVERMIDALALARGATILDVGCGPGELVSRLLQLGYDASGVDISPGMVEEARHTIEGHGVSALDHISVGDIEALNFDDGTFDVVVASGVIEYQKDDHRALSEMRRVLKTSGHLIVNVANKYSYVTVSEDVYMTVKKSAVVESLFTFLRQRMRGDGRLAEMPDRRTHVPKRFDRTLAGYGFEKVCHNFFRFSPMPVPFDSLFPSACGRVGLWMERRLTGRALAVLGGGYLVMARKEVTGLQRPSS